MSDKKISEAEEKAEKETSENSAIEFIPVNEEAPGEETGASGKAKPPSEKEKSSQEQKQTVTLTPKGDRAEGGNGAPANVESEDTSKLRSRLHKKDAEIKALRKERDEWKDKYLRSLAEMDNARKRLEREKDEFMRYALADLLKELLAVVDNFERALQVKDESNGRSFQEGVVMIYRQLLDLLRRFGVRPIEIVDKKFDPSVQQAVLTEEMEGIEEPEVAEFLQRGYWLHDRLLRPAMVKVLVPKKNP